jgi:hypothetical protein
MAYGKEESGNLNTGNYLEGGDDYEIMDVKDHPAHNMPPAKTTQLGLTAIGPNHDLGDE